MLEATVHGGCEGGSCGRVCMGLGGQRELLRGRICRWLCVDERERGQCFGGCWRRWGRLRENTKKIQNRGVGQTAAWRRDRFRVLFLCCLSPQISKLPPSKYMCSMVFIGKVLLGFQISPSTFPFLLFSSFL
jgi:hypothetical protein